MNLQDLTGRDLGVGIGLRSVHYGHVLDEKPELDWFEILSENYMNTGGRPLHILDQVAERYPIVMHGVSMNIGSADELDFPYLRELKALRERCGAVFLSDHLCWTGVHGQNLHDLLPMPYTDDALKHLIGKIHQVQDVIEAPLVLENPSTYLEFKESTMTEWEFLAQMAKESGCGLLLDVNNIYVCARNHGFDPYEYLDNTPWDHVVQFHLAGHTDYGTHLLDTHSAPACDEVWKMYRHAHKLSGGRSTLFEWDDEIPSFDDVVAEAHKARTIRQESVTMESAP
jgi:uncharacterized protein (UPF0276 family)